MGAEHLLMTGATRVRGPAGDIVGFVFAESIAGGQLQRWILHRFESLYRLEPWLPELPLAAWKTMVTTLKPPAPPAWGEAPESGLWEAGAYYVVAQSKEVLLSVDRDGAWYGPLPEPTFPRSEVVRMRAPGGILAPGGSSSGSTGPNPNPLPPPKTQLGVGDHTLSQLALQGRAYSDAVIEASASETFWEASEYFLLYTGYQRAGKPGQPETEETRIEKGPLNLVSAEAFHTVVLAEYVEGCRYEVTGCNYYQGADPPPEWFL